MAYAINNYQGIHSRPYADKVLELLEAAVACGRTLAQKRQSVIDALADMRQKLERGEAFWPQVDE